MVIDQLFNYLLEKQILSEDNIEVFKFVLAELGEQMPGDKMNASRKDQKLLNISEDLSWNKLAINRYLDKKRTEYNKTRDNVYTMLVRQNRPSNEAICCEIRTKNPVVYEMEEDIKFVQDILEWIDHLEKSIDRYIYALRDKFKKDGFN